MLLFDIETTGLRKETTQLYLIGCAYCEKDRWFIRQWLTERASDEIDVLEDFLEFSSGYQTLVHFNGDRFDLPYLQYKCAYYKTRRDLAALESFDIYAHARTVRPLLGMTGMSQKAIEAFLGISREDQMNGGLLIPVYYEFEKTGDSSRKDLLLLHNFDDLQGMLRILPILAYPAALRGGFVCQGWEPAGDTLRILCQLFQPVPVRVSLDLYPDSRYRLKRRGQEDIPDGKRPIRIVMEKDLLAVDLPLVTGTLCLPLAPVTDYYYLPDEDIVIHKDVAGFLNRSRKERATAANCFVRKEGQFFFQPVSDWIPRFSLSAPGTPLYSSYEDLQLSKEHDPETAGQNIKKLVLHLLSSF